MAVSRANWPQECTKAAEDNKGEVVMKSLLKPLAAALIAATSLTGIAITTASPAAAETVLRLDEVAVGELDPAKATDYADSILMFNVYDTLVLPKQGGAGVRAASRRKLGDRRQDLHLQAAHRREIPERQPADGRRRGLLARPHEGDSARACPTSSPMSRRPRPSMPAPSSSRSPVRIRRSSRRCCACRSSTRSWSWKISATAKAT